MLCLYLVLFFNILTVKYNLKEKIGGPSIFEDVKMAELDMVLNELHLHHLYQLLKPNRVMVRTQNSHCYF